MKKKDRLCKKRFHIHHSAKKRGKDAVFEMIKKEDAKHFIIIIDAFQQ